MTSSVFYPPPHRSVGWVNTYMVCGCQVHCIPSIEEAAKISSPVAPSVYLPKGQSDWRIPACMHATQHRSVGHTLLHEDDTPLLLSRKHYTRARKVHTYRRKCGDNQQQQLFLTITSTCTDRSASLKPTKSYTPTSKLKKYRHENSRHSLGHIINGSRCLTSTVRSQTSSTGTRCPNSSLR